MGFLYGVYWIYRVLFNGELNGLLKNSQQAEGSEQSLSILQNFQKKILTNYYTAIYYTA